MASNNDHVMSRFLFAILEQKCLKDIDWNKVARNPVLAQPITNGHAARMRFSRFRSAVLGLEPQRRNRVTKKKKDEPAKKPKKEEEEGKASGSGIGNIKTETKAETKVETTGPPTIKSEHTTASLVPPHPVQPPAPMGVPELVKTETANTTGHSLSRLVRQPSVLCVASPHIKKEALPQKTATTPTGPSTSAASTTAGLSVPEPAPTIIAASESPAAPATTVVSAAPTPYVDSNSYHPLPLRLPTPCSDSDGMPAFLRHTPPPSAGGDLPHSQRSYAHTHSQQHPSQQHHAMVGAGSPPLSTTASSPYDFTQCMDFDPSPASAPGSSGNPWQSQQNPFHTSYYSGGGGSSQAYPHSQPAAAAPLFPLPADMSTSYPGYNNPHGGTFCSDHSNLHQHHLHHPLQHQHQQQRYHHTLLPHPLSQNPGYSDEDAPGEVDPLGLHLGFFDHSYNMERNGRCGTASIPRLQRDISKMSQGHGQIQHHLQAQGQSQNQSQAQTQSQAPSEAHSRAPSPGHGHGHEQNQDQGQSQGLSRSGAGKDDTQSPSGAVGFAI